MSRDEFRAEIIRRMEAKRLHFKKLGLPAHKAMQEVAAAILLELRDKRGEGEDT